MLMNNAMMVGQNTNPEVYNIVNKAQYYYDKLFSFININVILYLFFSFIISVIMIFVYIFQQDADKLDNLSISVLLTLLAVFIIINIILFAIIIANSNSTSVYLNENILLNDFNYSKNINDKYLFKWLLMIPLLISFIMILQKTKLIRDYFALITFSLYQIWIFIYSIMLKNAIDYIKNMNKDAYYQQKAYKIIEAYSYYKVYIYMNGQDKELII